MSKDNADDEWEAAYVGAFALVLFNRMVDRDITVTQISDIAKECADEAIQTIRDHRAQVAEVVNGD